MSSYLIRPGEESDIPALLQLIIELAEYERAAHKVANSEEQLLTDWRDTRSFDFLVAEADSTVVGMALYYPRYSTWNGRCFYLEDLYVKPEMRGKGIGLALIKATAREAKKAGAGRLDWQVIDWNDSAVKFYEQLGAVVEKEWWNCKWEL